MEHTTSKHISDTSLDDFIEKNFTKSEINTIKKNAVELNNRISEVIILLESLEDNIIDHSYKELLWEALDILYSINTGRD